VVTRLAALLLALGGAAGLGGWLGWELGQAGPLQELAELRTAQAETDRLAARSHAQSLGAAQTRSDGLTRRVRELERQGAKRLKERRDAMQAATLGQPCLGPGALRVFDGAPGLRLGLPTPGSRAAGTDATATAAASDRDLGLWALEAGEQYERCRARLAALIDWHEPQTTEKKGPTE